MITKTHMDFGRPWLSSHYKLNYLRNTDTGFKEYIEDNKNMNVSFDRKGKTKAEWQWLLGAGKDGAQNFSNLGAWNLCIADTNLTVWKVLD